MGTSAGLAAVVVWGLSSVALKQVEGLNGIGIACYRIWLGAVLVTSAFYASGRRLDRRILRAALPGGLAFTADLVLFFCAVQATSVANATVIGALQPVLVLGIGRRLFGEMPRRAELAWGTVAVVGAAVVVLGGDGGGATSRGGDLLAVGALVSWTAYFAASKSARQTLSAFEYLTGMAVVAAVAVVPIPVVYPAALGTTNANGWMVILYLTVVNGLLGHFLMSWAHGHITLLTASLLTLGIPVFATAGAALWIDEPVTLVQAVGMAVVLVALGCVSVSQARRSPAVVEADVDAIEAAPHP